MVFFVFFNICFINAEIEQSRVFWTGCLCSFIFMGLWWYWGLISGPWGY
jgi:hypothetical protein